MTIKNGTTTTGKALAYAHGMFRDPDFVEFSPELVKQIGCQPNTLYQADKDIGRVRVLVVYRSEGGDFALGKIGLDHLLGAQQEGKIAVGVVVLTEDFDTVTKAGWIVSVMGDFRNAPLRRGRRHDYGPFYWSDANLCPAPPRGAPRPYITDPDTPF